ncbi:phenol acid carboxylase [Neofusicoccum parvum]|nr:phenol acid carboxylase [Neofusicoccum parvum]
MDPETKAHWDKDLKDLHMVYDYNAKDEQGNPEKWRYEIWFQTEDRVVYKIHGGPMAGRANYQTCSFQCIRPGELWQCNWLEETGTIVSLVYDIPSEKITTLIAFSKGHWEHAEEAHGDKRNPEDFERWRGLAKLGTQIDRKMLPEQADILEVYRGKGELEPIEHHWPTV